MKTKGRGWAVPIAPGFVKVAGSLVSALRFLVGSEYLFGDTKNKRESVPVMTVGFVGFFSHL